MPEAALITTLPNLPERIFVSYTHDTPEHCARVRRMVQRLREMGFTVVFDEDQPAGGPDLGWATWSENEAANAPRVIVVATEAFGKCWLGQHPPGMRDGATWEAGCLVNRTYIGGAGICFIRAVIFNEADVAHIPMRLRGLTRYNGETGLDGLMAWLHGEREPAPAPAPVVATAAPAAQREFDVSQPATGAAFVGRSAELTELDFCFVNGGGRSLVGDARIGKSSLLIAWCDRARAAGHHAHVVNFQACAVDYASFLTAATGGAIKPPGQGLTADTAADLLAQWAATQSKPPVILMDETEAAIRQLEHRFFERLRALTQEHRAIFMIGSRRPLPDIFAEKGDTSPFANVLLTWRLGLLDDTAAAALASRAGEYAGLLRHWAGNHPYYLQALGSWLRRTGPDFTVEEALRRFRDTAAERLAESAKTLGPRATAALEQAATGLPVDHSELKTRGLLTSAGRPFGQVLLRWLREKE